MLKDSTAFEDAFGMPLDEYSEKYSKDAHFRNQQINSGEFDANLKSLRESLKEMGWEPKGFPGKKSKAQESNAGAQNHVNGAVTEVFEETDATPGEVGEAQQLISDATGITHAEPVEIVQGSAEEVAEGDNVYQIDFSQDPEREKLNKQRPKTKKAKANLEKKKEALNKKHAEQVQATLSKHGDAIESVTDVGDGIFVINISDRVSDDDKNKIIDVEDLEVWKQPSLKMAARGGPSKVQPESPKLPKPKGENRFKDASTERLNEILAALTKR